MAGNSGRALCSGAGSRSNLKSLNTPDNFLRVSLNRIPFNPA
jgi:hypothetical protein